MTGVDWTLRSAERGESGVNSRVIAKSFTDLAIARYLVPGDPHLRRHCLAGQFEMLIDQAHRDGRIDVATVGDRIVAVAVWRFQLGPAPLPDPPGYAEKLRRICGPEVLPRVLLLDQTFAEHHPAFAHHHLLLCGVDPEFQNRGIGAALLTRHHQHIDSRPAGVRPTAYLEASSDKSAELYSRLDYVAIEAVDIPGSGTSFLPMFRAPQPPSSADLHPFTQNPSLGRA
jgi:ribosomal protein S18 acetylase RimI-like enzyme